MSKPKLDKEEHDALQAYDKGELRSRLTPKRVKELRSVAEETFKKDRRINIRLSSRDLAGLQRRALEEGVPYQTLVSSILHKYVSGSLQDIAANKSRKKDAPKRAPS